MKNKQLIKQEIERIIEEETPISKGSDYYHGAKESMDKLLQFIDSFPEEPYKPNYCHHEVDLSDYSEEYRKAYYDGWNNCNMQHDLLKNEQFDYHNATIITKDFIGKHTEEPSSEDLEGEIIKVWKDSEDNGNLFELGKLRIIARHFAEWQRKKDQETIELAEDHAMLAGMMKEREEMMKDAVELTITNTSFIPLPKLDIKAGDKVKIVVLKTE